MEYLGEVQAKKRNFYKVAAISYLKKQPIGLLLMRAIEDTRVYVRYAIVCPIVKNQICTMQFSKEELAKQLGKNIRTCRLNRQMSIEQVALDAGMEYTQLSRIELGKINTSIYQVYRISISLRVSMVHFFSEIDPQLPPSTDLTVP